MKEISSTPIHQPKKQSGTGPQKKQFIVIEVPKNTDDPTYPKAIFACDTVEEAMNLCNQMNADAGYERYGVQRPAKHK